VSIGDTLELVFLFDTRRFLRDLQSKLTITPRSPIKTAHANLPMLFEDTLASDLDTSLPRALVVLEWSMVRFVTRISMIAVDVRLTHSLFW